MLLGDPKNSTFFQEIGRTDFNETLYVCYKDPSVGFQQ